ncbi:hypothetical protein [Richelia intracellularis]|uniref:hypothetical protein n=1 Tax=Richelia intracellularis TaxID=1164990 RepID=UPI0012DBDDD5|nr:hypothetical protein [Richelia intracellularis]
MASVYINVFTLMRCIDGLWLPIGQANQFGMRSAYLPGTRYVVPRCEQSARTC